MEAPQRHMYYVGLDIHKKTISYCVKDASGRIHQEGKIGATRRELDGWMKTLPQPWTVAGGDDLHRLGIRPRASPRHRCKGRSPCDAASDCRGEEEERPNRCRQDCGLSAVRFPSGMSHGGD